MVQWIMTINDERCQTLCTTVLMASFFSSLGRVLEARIALPFRISLSRLVRMLFHEIDVQYGTEWRRGGLLLAIGFAVGNNFS